MFNKIASQRLREMAEQLAVIGAEESTESPHCRFAKCLSVLMRVELARRSNADEE